MGAEYSSIIKKAIEAQHKNTDVSKYLTKFTSVQDKNASSLNSINEVAKVAGKTTKPVPMALLKPVVRHTPATKVVPKPNPKPQILNHDYTGNEKKVIYTCVTGGYDTVKDPKVVSKGFDYICFTDNPCATSNIWQIRPLPEGLEGLSNVKKQRYVKVNAHKVLPEYELSIWADGCVELRADVNELLKTIPGGYSLYVPKHPVRNCIYQEAEVCARLKKEDPKIMNPQLLRYRKELFPKNYGLPQTNIVIRWHNHDDCKRIMETWWNEIKNGSHRDQLSFSYAAWKNMDVKFNYLDKDIYKSKWFLWNGKHQKSQISYIVTTPTTNTKVGLTFCIIHYNTPELTAALVKSINKFNPGSEIYIFDNSNEKPFINTFDNVILFDNTKGQIINFDEWLKKYPRRVKSPGASNQWGSAKHCYSVEKCMELIGKSFILLDSDVLLKKCVSPVWDERCAYVAEVANQPQSTIKRVLPFITFINVDYCKKHKIHYFDENHMHGLAYNTNVPRADSYDTGAGFYLQTEKHPHKLIKYEEYVIHFKGGSWSDVYSKRINRNMTPEEWMNENKKYWE